MKLSLILASSIGLFVTTTCSAQTSDNWFCGEDAPCVVTFDADCPTIVEQYVFEGQCCSLSDGDDNLCVLTVTSGSCTYFDRAAVEAGGSGGAEGCIDMSGMLEDFQFPSFVRMPDFGDWSVTLPDASTPVENVVNRTTAIREDLVEEGGNILNNLANNIGGALNSSGIDVSGFNVSGFTDGITDGLGDIMPEDLETPAWLTNFTEWVTTLDVIPEIPCFSALFDADTTSGIYVRISALEDMCPADSYNVLGVPESNEGPAAGDAADETDAADAGETEEETTSASSFLSSSFYILALVSGMFLL